ncbi:MAG: hypothetical protein U0704_14745 [Candidatus Eisenbacteria bacterium]
MKQLRLVALVLAASLACAAIAFACGGNKSASASGASCSAGTHATAASAPACCAGGASATAANAKGAKGAKGANAMQCSPEMAAACTPEMKAACAAGGASCSMHGTTAAAAMDCAVCAEGASCDEDVNAAGAHRQVVALKNGAMIVYTADTPENVRTLQAAVARHNTAMVAVLGGKRAGNLCAHCKPLRGAMASGKLTREVVNVQRGAQIVITSPDRATVQRIHDMTGAEMATRVRD